MKKLDHMISFTNLDQQWTEIREEALPLIDKVLSSGKYLEHEIINELEESLAKFIGCKEVILVNSGTDALMLSLHCLGIEPGDEVITVPNSFIASVAAISHLKAEPVIVDVGDDHLIDIDKITSQISKKTRAIIPVHLEGNVCKMDEIIKIANEHHLHVVEDAAQAFGSKLNGVRVGNLGEVACFSLHPLKNLNACGDSGFIATNNSDLAQKIRIYRNHGQNQRNRSDEFGVVSRFDSIQGAILSIRLRDVEKVIEQRRLNAAVYNSKLRSPNLSTPIVRSEVLHSYHLYVIEINNREKIMNELLESGIQTKVHYPRLITEQLAYTSKHKKFDTPIAFKQREKILSLPIHTSLSQEDLLFISERIVELSEKYR